jgi:predicted choloylglycine hydrolase
MEISEQTFFDDADSFLTLRHVTVRGTNSEIGHMLGQLAMERHNRSPADYVADPTYARGRRAYYQRNYPIHWERVRGVASAFGIDPEDDGYDFTALFYNLDAPLLAPGCSVVYYPPSSTVDGRGYLSRNYDFSTGTMADVFRVPLPQEVKNQMPRVMSEPYIMEWHPQDGGYASLAIQSFDLLSGTLDGINNAGLVVSVLADEEAIGELGPKLEMHPGTPHVVGLHELQVMRYLLDTCATAEEAKEALLTAKQYYTLAPCHYIIADKAGGSFIYENSTGRNAQHIIEGTGRPQVITNFQVHKHPTPAYMPRGPLTLETNTYWRFLKLTERISNQEGPLSSDDIKANNACVNIVKLFERARADPSYFSIAASVTARTLWHSLYDQEAGTVEFSFYLGETVDADGTIKERRSDYVTFGLEGYGEQRM